MFLLAAETVDLLKAHDFGYPNVKVVRSFDAADKTYPRIIVRQMQEATLIRDVDEQELTIVAIQIEVYAADALDEDGNAVSRDTVLDDISSQIDQLIMTQYKFNHDDTTENFMFTTDVAMRLMRYSGVVDKFGYTYRSSRFPYGGYTYENFY